VRAELVAEVPSLAPPVLAEDGQLDLMRLDQLRHAIRANQISFPSPVPTFSKHDRPDLQWRIAQLYFVLGRDCESIGTRYGITHKRVRQILNTWKRRAVATGYVQRIPPGEAVSPSRPSY
jgi:hypothetical protein